MRCNQWSTYASNFDNPIRYQDARGDMPDCCKGILEGVKSWIVGQSILGLVKNTTETVKAAASGDKSAQLSLVSYSGSKVVEGKQVFTSGTSDQKQAFVTTTTLDIAGGFLMAKISAPEPQVTLYRGVNESSPAYESAMKGVVEPRGGATGTATPLEHNTQSTANSPFTSWTKNPAVAENFALRPNGNGVVLKATIPKSATVESPNLKSVILNKLRGVL